MPKRLFSGWRRSLRRLFSPRPVAPARRPRPLAVEGLEDRGLPAPLYAIHLHAIQVADDDGSHQAAVTPAQVKQWVDKANEIYFTAGIQIDFDPNDASAFSTLNNTTINSVYYGSPAAPGNSVAALYPGEAVAFFRYRKGAESPTGNGFSGDQYNFIAMPGFDVTTVITGQNPNGSWQTSQNIWLFAHECGHYLGLDHTFPGDSDNLTDTPEKALRYIAEHGFTADALDGDGLADTPPDAGKLFYTNQKWDPNGSAHASYTIGPGIVDVNGLPVLVPAYTFTPDRHNIMSYFAFDRMGVTPMQTAIMRQTAVNRGIAKTPGVLHVYGDPGARDDAITVTRVGSDLKVDVNDLSVTVSLASVSSIEVDGRGGYDSLTTNLDTDNPAGATYTITEDTVSRTGLPLIRYASTESLEVQTASGPGITANVLSTQAGTEATIDGARKVNVGSGGHLDGVAGPVLVKNLPNFTKLTVDDSADATLRAVTLDTTPLDGSAWGRVSWGGTGSVAYNPGDVSAATVHTGLGGATVNVKATRVPLSLVGHANGAVTVGDAGSVENILGNLTITNPPAYWSLTVDDSADKSAPTFAHDTVGGADYGRINNLAAGVIDYKYADVSGVTIYTGVAGATANIKGTGKPVSLIGHSNGTVKVGDAGNIAKIKGNVTLTNPPAYWSLTVDDSNDPNPRIFVHDTVNVGGADYGRVSTTPDLGTILYKYADTSGATLKTGAGGATVNVKATGKPLSLIANANGTVNIGDAGSVQQLLAALTISDPPAYVALNIDDSADPDGRSATLGRSGGLGILAGLASQASINFAIADVSAINLSTGLGADTVALQSVANPLTLNTDGDAVADTITLGNPANKLANVTSPMTVHGGTADTLTFNDQGTGTARKYTAGPGSVTWADGAVVGPTVSYTGLGAVAVNGGTAADTYVLAGTTPTAWLTVTGGTGNNTVVGSASSNIWYLPGTNKGMLFGPSYPTQPTFSNMPNLRSSPVGDTYEFADGAKVTGSIAGSGQDTLDYRNYSTSVVVDLQLASPGMATGVGGTVSGVHAVFGGTVPAAPGADNLLIGNGSNYLAGGTGRRNILVTGAAPGQLVGGDGEDLMITGTTSYDTQASLTNWKAIAAYWAGSDDFARRAANLLRGVGVPKLDTSTVTGSGPGNHLSGQGGAALLYNDGLDPTDGFVYVQTIPIGP